MVDPKPHQNKSHIEWNSVVLAIDELSSRILKTHKHDNIFGIPRGGLVPAVIMSHMTNLPLITDEKKITTRTLIVDDICDSGETLDVWKYKHPNVDMATIMVRRGQKKVPAYYYAPTVEDEWVVFPWER